MVFFSNARETSSKGKVNIINRKDKKFLLTMLRRLITSHETQPWYRNKAKGSERTTMNYPITRTLD